MQTIHRRSACFLPPPKEVIFSLLFVCLFVCLSVCEQDYRYWKLWTDFHETRWVNYASAKDETIRFWEIQIWTWIQDQFSTFPTWRDMTFRTLNRTTQHLWINVHEILRVVRGIKLCVLGIDTRSKRLEFGTDSFPDPDSGSVFPLFHIIHCESKKLYPFCF